MLVLVIILVVIIIQIIYIRVHLQAYKAEKVKEINQDSREVPNLSNVVKSYGLQKHEKHTKLLNELNNVKNINFEISDISFALCNNEPVSKQVVYNKGIFLVIEKGSGGYNLVKDILNEITKYIVFDNKVYRVHFSHDLSEAARKVLMENTNTDVNILANQEIMVIIKLDNSFRFVDNEPKCTEQSSYYPLVFRGIASTHNMVSNSTISSISSTLYTNMIVLGFNN